MTDFNFKKWNNILAWFVFAVALMRSYALTIEPTVSFWDAGEYILTSSKLQVGHPPGAPLFQMMGAFFSIFALGAVTNRDDHEYDECHWPVHSRFCLCFGPSVCCW